MIGFPDSRPYALTPAGREPAEQLRLRDITRRFRWQPSAGPSVAEVEARQQPCPHCTETATCADCHEEAAWQASVHPRYVVDDGPCDLDDDTGAVAPACPAWRSA